MRIYHDFIFYFVLPLLLILSHFTSFQFECILYKIRAISARQNVKRFNNKSILQSICGADASISAEVSRFILSGSVEKWDISYFDSFPNVKQVFLKYNSIHTCEADVERLLSYAGKSIWFIYIHVGHMGTLSFRNLFVFFTLDCFSFCESIRFKNIQEKYCG